MKTEPFLRALDAGFHVLHLAMISFVLFGWLFETTRLAHHILSLAILSSWYLLGLCLGPGYCLITDLQWRIKRRLGREPATKFYIKYMLDKITGLDTNPLVVDRTATAIFMTIFIVSSILLYGGR